MATSAKACSLQLGRGAALECPTMRKSEQMGTNTHAKAFQEIVCGRKGVVGKKDANVFLIKILQG